MGRPAAEWRLMGQSRSRLALPNDAADLHDVQQGPGRRTGGMNADCSRGLRLLHSPVPPSWDGLQTLSPADPHGRDSRVVLEFERAAAIAASGVSRSSRSSGFMGVKKTGKGRRKIGRKKRKMRSRIRHRKG
jgi:hypothetical protein